MATNVFGDPIVETQMPPKRLKTNVFGDPIADDTPETYGAAVPANLPSGVPNATPPREVNGRLASSFKMPTELETPKETRQRYAKEGAAASYQNPRTGKRFQPEADDTRIPLLDSPISAYEGIKRGVTSIGASNQASDEAVKRGATPITPFAESRDKVAGGVADIAGGVLEGLSPLLPGEFLTKAGAARALASIGLGMGADKAVEGATGAMGATPGVQRLFGTAAGLGVGALTANKVGSLPETVRQYVDRVPDPVKAVVEAHKPRNTQVNYADRLKLGMPEVKQSESEMRTPDGAPFKVQDIDTELSAIQHAKKRLWGVVEGFLGPRAKEVIPMDNVRATAEAAIRKATPPEDQHTLDGKVAKYDIYNKGMTVADAEAAVKQYNAILDDFEAQSPHGKYVDLASNPNTATTFAVREQVKQNLYDYLEQKTGNTSLREAKKRYGALMEMEQTALRRKVVNDRQNPNNLAQQFTKIRAVGQGLKGGAQVVGGLATSHPGLAVKGVGNLAEAGLDPKIASLIRERDSTNGLIRRAYDQFTDSNPRLTTPATNPALSTPPKPSMPSYDPNTGIRVDVATPRAFEKQGNYYGGHPDENLDWNTGEFRQPKTDIHVDLSGLPNIPGHFKMVPDPLGVKGPKVIGSQRALLPESTLPSSAQGVFHNADVVGNMAREAQGHPPMQGGPTQQFDMVMGPYGVYEPRGVQPPTHPPIVKGLPGIVTGPLPYEPPPGFRGDFNPEGSSPATPESSPPGTPSPNIAGGRPVDLREPKPTRRFRGMEQVFGSPIEPPLPPHATPPGRLPTEAAPTTTLGQGGSAALHANPEDPIRLGLPQESVDALAAAQRGGGGVKPNPNIRIANSLTQPIEGGPIHNRIVQSRDEAGKMLPRDVYRADDAAKVVKEAAKANHPYMQQSDATGAEWDLLQGQRAKWNIGGKGFEDLPSNVQDTLDKGFLAAIRRRASVAEAAQAAEQAAIEQQAQGKAEAGRYKARLEDMKLLSSRGAKQLPGQPPQAILDALQSEKSTATRPRKGVIQPQVEPTQAAPAPPADKSTVARATPKVYDKTAVDQGVMKLIAEYETATKTPFKSLEPDVQKARRAQFTKTVKAQLDAAKKTD